MSKSINGHYVGTATINSGKCYYITSSMLPYLPEQVTFVERNAITQLYVKHKLYVSGCRSTSHTIFEARPWGKTHLGTATMMLILLARELLIEMRQITT
ncbi:hypothetical protein HanIR_Chr04g0177731 [Helianthus annuus]|nr:hypothetical protein HanIR_Chr04g0177731 [Helianthus annuus]